MPGMVIGAFQLQLEKLSELPKITWLSLCSNPGHLTSEPSAQALLSFGPV